MKQEEFNLEVEPRLEGLPEAYKLIILNAVCLAMGREDQAPDVVEYIEEAKLLVSHLLKEVPKISFKLDPKEVEIIKLIDRDSRFLPKISLRHAPTGIIISTTPDEDDYKSETKLEEELFEELQKRVFEELTKETRGE